MPLLEVDGKMICQSNAGGRYLAKYFSKYIKLFTTDSDNFIATSLSLSPSLSPFAHYNSRHCALVFFFSIPHLNAVCAVDRSAYNT